MEGLAPGFGDFGLEAVLTAIGIVGIEVIVHGKDAPEPQTLNTKPI